MALQLLDIARGAFYSTTSELVARATQNGFKCEHVTPDENGAVPDGACKDYYSYTPNFGAAGFFCVAFGICVIAHIALMVKWKTWYAWTLLMGTAWESASFAVRFYGGHNQQEEMPVTVYMSLFLVAPLWLNAFIYMTAARLAYKYTPKHSIFKVRASWMGKIFILLDIFCFFIQIIGAGILASAHGPKDIDQLKRGVDIFCLGIGVQEGFIIIFLAFLIKMHLQTNQLRYAGALPPDAKIRRVLIVLYIGLLAISVRVIFHITAFQKAKNGDSSIMDTEAYELGLDAAMILLATALLAIVHPGQSLGTERAIPNRRIRKEERRRLKETGIEAKVLNPIGHSPAISTDVESGVMHTGYHGGYTPVDQQHSVGPNGQVFVPHRY